MDVFECYRKPIDVSGLFVWVFRGLERLESSARKHQDQSLLGRIDLRSLKIDPSLAELILGPPRSKVYFRVFNVCLRLFRLFINVYLIISWFTVQEVRMSKESSE